MSTDPRLPTLENCDREPIHIPGSIQPHGALLAFDRLGRLTHASANARELLGLDLRYGQAVPPEAWGADTPVPQMLKRAVDAAGSNEPSSASGDIVLAGRSFDVIVHTHLGAAICEFELRDAADDEVTRYAHLAYRLTNTLRQQQTIDRLLGEAVRAVRALIGYDRVMAYRFRHDDSGMVVAEAREDTLEPYLGMRYPASDIPAQARRLYTLNTLRLIPDIGYKPVPILAAPSCIDPLDLSHSVLRSVSPIHVEYLQNMGVAASMSVSIVVNGRLWGMLACHHMQPRRVPYPLRMAADVMAQIIAATVQSLDAQRREAAIARAAWARTEIVREVARGADVGEAVQAEAGALRDSLQCAALMVTLDGVPRVVVGDVPQEWAAQLAAWLETQDASIVHVHDGAQLPPWPDDAESAPRYCGVLALRYDTRHGGWIVALRPEQVQTIRWGGKPDKTVTVGPNGPRLTPRGSFTEWQETVRGTAEPWDAVALEIASQLQDSVSRAHADRVLEVEHMRAQLWAVVGHDLRNPLQSLTMATGAIARGSQSAQLNAIVQSSTQRMKQLVSNVLDLARLQQGFEFTMAFESTDAVALVRQLVDETRTAHPAAQIDVQLPDALQADMDPARFAQVVANLLSNARHHGHGTAQLQLRVDADALVLLVTNASPPIPPEVAQSLFDPFKRQNAGNVRNRTGMGLGLYIAHQVVQGHGGTLRYVPGDGTVSFEARVPLQRPAAPAAE